MKMSGISAALPAQDLDQAKDFYIEKVGLLALESSFLEARDGQVGLTVGDGTNRETRRPLGGVPPGTHGLLHVVVR